MARKQPPPGFDPHPGDPWHPNWSPDESTEAAPEPVEPGPAAAEGDTDTDWWQRALTRQDSAGDPAAVPEAYAALERADEPEPAEVDPDLADSEQVPRTSWWRRALRRSARPGSDPVGPDGDAESGIAADSVSEAESPDAALVEDRYVELEVDANLIEDLVSNLESTADRAERVGPDGDAETETAADPASEAEPRDAALVEDRYVELEVEAKLIEDLVARLEAEAAVDAGAVEAVVVEELEPEVEPEAVVAAAVVEELVAELGSDVPAVDSDVVAESEPEVESVGVDEAAVVEELVAELESDAELAEERVEGLGPDLEVELVAAPEPEVEPEAVVAAGVVEELVAELGSEVNAVDSDVVAEAAVVEELEPEFEREIEPESELGLEFEPESEPGLAFEPESNIGLEIELAVEPEIELAVEPESGLEPEVGLEPEIELAVEPESEVGLESEIELAVEPESEVGLESEIELAVEPEPESEYEPEPESEFERAVGPEPESEYEPEPESEFERAVGPEPESESDPEPEPDEEDLAAAAAAAAARVRRVASATAAEDSLQAADLAHQEDARMREAISAIRTRSAGAPELTEEDEARQAERMAVRAALAEEVRRIEASRLEVEASVQRTAAEVRSTLDGRRQILESTVPERPDRGVEDVGAFFSATAEDQKAYDDADFDRMERREELRLRTSLLVVDADQPWAAEGWSRPGSWLGASPVPSPEPVRLVTSPHPIDSGSVPTVPESAPRRRWSWSRRRDTPTSPSTLRHVVVVKEQSVTGREDETGSEGQDELPFDEVESSPEAANGDLGELGTWSDMDWDFDTDVTTPVEASPAGADSPDGEPSDEAEADESPDTWETFTAEDYVQTATHEYADLAAAVAAAETEETEQAALSADMPGLESSLVSLDDVVAAEGMERAAAAPDRSDLAIRVLTAAALIILFFASLAYRWSIGLLVLLVMTVAAGELATSLTRRGFHPVGLFSYLGTVGALAGTWIYGPVAIPVSVAVTILVVVLFFGLVTGRQDPLTGMALTVITVMWVGVFGALAYDLVEAGEYRWLIAALVIIVAGMDVASYFVGKRLGKRPLAPVVSPKKTVAGLVGGVGAAVGIGYGLSFMAPFDWQTGLVLGAALAVTGPLGDLAVSVLKRAMDVKDMGTILPGHGGVVDRIDAILFSIPAAWFVYAWAGLLV